MTTLLINDRAFHQEGALPIHERGAYYGTWLHNDGGVLLMSLNRNPAVQIVNNGRDAPFFVTVSRTPEGKLWHVQGLCTSERDWLGLPESNAARAAIAKQALNDVSPVPAIALITRELRPFHTGGGSWDITASTQWLPLGVPASAPAQAMATAIRERLEIAGLHVMNLHAATLAAGKGVLATLQVSPTQRITLDFEASSHPSGRYHGAPGDWPRSQLDSDARTWDWRAEPLPIDATPTPAASTGPSF